MTKNIPDEYIEYVEPYDDGPEPQGAQRPGPGGLEAVPTVEPWTGLQGVYP